MDARWAGNWSGALWPLSICMAPPWLFWTWLERLPCWWYAWMPVQRPHRGWRSMFHRETLGRQQRKSQKSTEQWRLTPRLFLVCHSPVDILGLTAYYHHISFPEEYTQSSVRQWGPQPCGCNWHSRSPLDKPIDMSWVVTSSCNWNSVLVRLGRSTIWSALSKTRIICWSCCGDYSMGCDPGRLLGRNVFYNKDKLFRGMWYWFGVPGRSKLIAKLQTTPYCHAASDL